MENEKLMNLKKATEELIQNNILMIGTLIKLYEAATVEVYKKAHPELSSAIIIRYSVEGERLPKVILTTDYDEIRKFHKIMESYFHPKKKEYLDLRVNRIQFSKVDRTSSISSLAYHLPKL